MKNSIQIALCGAALLTASAAAQTPLRGVNIAGAEFGEGTIPGDFNTHYTFNSEETFAYFATRGLPLLRVPIRWERIQRQPFGELDADYLNGLRGNIAWAKAHGARVLIDVHNYGRYKLDEGGSRNEYVLDNLYGGEIKVPREALVNLWLRLSRQFRDEPGVHGYGLMNEPHDMGQADWEAISQETLSAIRADGDLKTIYVGGDSWSSAERWPDTHGPEAWIDDPANNTVYEAHLYFDQDASGRYFQGYDQELAANPNLLQVGRTRLQPFWDWCRSNEVRCFIGEYGVPGSDGRWLNVLDNLLTAMDEAGMGGTYWAAGDWWGDYPLSAQPSGGRDKPQMRVLLDHRGPAFATGVSAASFTAGPLAPGSLVSVFGKGLGDALQSAESLPLPTQLAGVRAELGLPDGSTRALELVFVSPDQINCLLPEPLPSGPAELRIFRDGTLLAVDSIVLAPAAPALFAADGSGAGPPAGQILRVGADGEREVELLASFDAESGSYSPRAISFRTPGERVFLILYGTGFRNASPGSELLWNGSPGPAVVYVGEQPDFPGLDQANLEVLPEMAGTGEATIRLVADGRTSNALTLLME